MNEPKCCPCCESPATAFASEYHIGLFVGTVRCMTCRLEFSDSPSFPTKDEAREHAISVWNRRPSHDPLIALAAEVAEASFEKMQAIQAYEANRSFDPKNYGGLLRAINESDSRTCKAVEAYASAKKVGTNGN